jgi:Fe-S-cluster containining protein
MADDLPDRGPGAPAGGFEAWIGDMRSAIRGERGSDVPCRGCTACCTSSQFIHIGPDESDTLSHIPARLLFPAPGLPAGNVLLGYDERGHCPMLIDNTCSIYEHRPKTCRTYDCRVFPAAGVEPGGDKVLIARQTRRWRFSFPTAADRTRHAAAQAAAGFLRTHRHSLPDPTVADDPTRLAVLAIAIHDMFLGCGEETGHLAVVVPDLDVVRAEIRRRTAAPVHPRTRR